jgi:alpha-glucosidase
VSVRYGDDGLVWWGLDDAGQRLWIDAPYRGIVRCRFAPSGDPTPTRSWAPARAPGQGVPITVTATEPGTVEVSTGTALVRIGDGLRVTVRRGDGSVVAEDGPAGGPCRSPTGGVAWRHRLPAGSSAYGFGERTGPLDKLGYRYTCWVTDQAQDHGPRTDAMHVAVPFRLVVDPAGDCHGLLADTTWRSAFDLTAIDDEVELVETDGPELTLWWFLGPRPDDVLDGYTLVTGRPALPPRWALGYHQTRWSYPSQDRVLEVAAELRRRDLPADVVGLDLDHMDRARVFTWSPERFPDPVGMHEQLADAGFRTVAIVDTAVERATGNRIFEEAVALGYLLRHDDGSLVEGHVWPGVSVLPDFVRPDVRRWWGDQLCTYVEPGVAGVLIDMNEPSLRDRPIDDPEARTVEIPPGTRHGDDETATHAEVHNVYGALEVQALAEGLRRLVPDERRLVLTRAGFAGVQRHAGVWTGDNASVWEHLQMSLPQLVNLGLSGIPFAGADVGGFFGHCTDELLVRWMQLGAWYPLMRSNNARESVDQEPWTRGPTVEAASRRCLELRARLLPYLYTCLATAHRTGTPMLRPLWWSWPRDADLRRIQDQAMVGPDLLVAPVVQPGATSRAVHLPAGTWYEWHGDRVHEGPADVLVAAPLDGPLPLFARGGAIVPTGPVLPWSDAQPLDPLVLEVFPGDGGVASGDLYEDDGISFDHEHEGWARTRWRWVAGALSSTTIGRFRPGQRTVRTHVRPATRSAPRSDPARDLEVDAGDIGGVVAQQERHGAGDLVE